LRVSGKNTALLGINREFEFEALRVASVYGIGPQVVHFDQGHLVTRFIEGRHWSSDEYRRPENLRRVVDTVKRLHALPPVKATYSPFRRAQSYADSARSFGVPFPQGFDDLWEKMREIESSRRQDPYPATAFCHNDLFSVNFMDDGESVRLLDWEFAGMGDVFFDLATLVYAYDTDGPLSPELEDYLLECYFGATNDAHRARLEQMKFMVNFFAAMWGVLQSGLQRAGLIPAVDGFDYLAYAGWIFNMLKQTL
ncbi:MAG: phosphotransferase, partial [Anaerolineae bacterium]